MHKRIQRALRALLHWSILLLMTLVLYLLGWLTSRSQPDWYRTLFRCWCQQFVRAFGVQLARVDHARQPLPGHYLLIANHPSAFEDIGLPALFAADSLAKAEVRHWWLVGRIARAAGTLFVEREDKRSRAAAVRSIEQRLRQGRNVALYPEGGVKGREVAAFRRGVFGISLRTGVPILPVFIHYHDLDSFYWQEQHLLHKMWQIQSARDKRVDFHVHDAIWPSLFRDEASYCDAVHTRYLEWQRQYTRPASADQA